MLQFATYESGGHTLKEQVEIAINAGCRWVRITGDNPDKTVEELIPLCRETETILVLDNNLKLVDRLRIHGLHLTDWTRGEVIAAREELGPHAILGVTCGDSSRMNELASLDVDYAVIPASSDVNPVEFYSEAIKLLHESNDDIHAVAAGDFPIDSYPAILATGIEGFEISGKVLDAPDPASFIHLAIQTLKQANGEN